METEFNPTTHKDANEEKKLRVMLIGASGVGKTSLISRIVNNYCPPKHDPTFGIVYIYILLYNFASYYKSIYNFFPSPDETSEYAYIELVDTMGIDLAEATDQEMSQFFKTFLVPQLEYNKYPIPALEKKIKYEFINTAKEVYGDDHPIDPNYYLTGRKLFSRVRIMAYLFIFDYNKDDTFEQVLDIARTFKIQLENQFEADKGTNLHLQEKMPMICFIGNKYPFYMNDDKLFEVNQHTKKIENKILNRDPKAQMMKKNINQRRIYPMEDDIDRNLFMVNAKSNFGVKQTFRTIFESILQSKSKLWDVKVASNEEQRKPVQEEVTQSNQTESRGFFAKLLCCFSSRNTSTETNERKKESADTKPKIRDRFGSSLNVHYQEEKDPVFENLAMNNSDDKIEKYGQDNKPLDPTENTKKKNNL